MKGLVVFAALLASTAAGAAALAAPDSVDRALWNAVGVVRPPDRAQAPAFTLNDLGGKPVSLGDFRGRLVMLYFWATW
jgi:hypothetical protein